MRYSSTYTDSTFITDFEERITERLVDTENAVTIKKGGPDDFNTQRWGFYVDRAGEWHYAIEVRCYEDRAEATFYADTDKQPHHDPKHSEATIGNLDEHTNHELAARDLADMLIASLGKMRKDFARPGLYRR